MASVGELINVACTLFLWADRTIKKGQTIASADESTRKYLDLDVSAVISKK